MRRWMILAIGLPLYTFALMYAAALVIVVLLLEGEPRDLDPTDRDVWITFGPTALVMVASQAVFVLPLLPRRPPRGERRRSLTLSLLVGGMVAGLLTAGFGAAVMELIAVVALPEREFDNKRTLWLIPLVMLGVGWVGWSMLLLLFVRSLWADRTLGRIVGLLLAGSLLEILVVVPLDVLVRRRTDCYCATGTFMTLGLAGFATLWLAGPGVVIALTAKKHRLWRERHCDRCGYAKGPSPGSHCPECGFGWAPAPPRTPRRRFPLGRGRRSDAAASEPQEKGD